MCIVGIGMDRVEQNNNLSYTNKQGVSLCIRKRKRIQNELQNRRHQLLMLCEMY